jgi:hypothetical protein
MEQVYHRNFKLCVHVLGELGPVGLSLHIPCCNYSGRQMLHLPVRDFDATFALILLLPIYIYIYIYIYTRCYYHLHH